jgi:hypothetical protein
MFCLLNSTASTQEFFTRLSNFNMTNVHAALLLMLFCVIGVFFVLMVFYVLIRLLQRIFPPKNQ